MSSENNSCHVTVTGVGIGLPGPDRHIFGDGNIHDLLNGTNFISRVSNQKIALQKQQNIIQKQRKDGETIFRSLTEEGDLVKLAGEAGKFDLVEEFKVGEELIDAWEITTQLAIAAGLEALKDAGIPLIKKQDGYSLPDEMVDNTGIIFASTFPAANTFLKEQSKYYEYANYLDKQKLAQELKDELGYDAEETINQTFSQQEPDYNFDRKYLLKAIPIQSGNLAQTINARGPNTSINSACASTTQAIAIAQDWIKLGRCDRVVIVAADDPTNDTTFHWIATGFLAAGAATTEPQISQAARPFDKHRSGMILGMGAVGIIIESLEAAENRGILPIAEIVDSYFANSAFHGTRMSPDHVRSCFEQFMRKIHEKHNLTPEMIASSCLYMSHETFTPPKGNAALTEIDALRHVFGEKVDKILISNTKGLTAHPMGVSFEDAAAIKAMEFGKTPPVANLDNPEFTELRFSTGESFKPKYAIRFAAGFGSQLVYVLFRNLFADERKTGLYEKWLNQVKPGHNLTHAGRTLIIS